MLFVKNKPYSSCITEFWSDKDKLKSYVEFSKKNKVTFVDCEHPLIEGFRVQNDGHPNAKSHKLYSDSIYSKVFKLII